MNDTNNQVDQKNIFWIIWGALLMTHIIYILLTLSEKIPVGQAAMSNALILFGSLSIAPLVLARVFFMRAKKMIADGVNLQNTFVFFVLAWALGESISIFGLIYAMQTTPETVQYAYSFFAAGIGMHLMNRPVFKAMGNNPQA